MEQKEVYEFYCNDCDGWILLTLNPNLRGEFVVECPECHRQHPRWFRDGEIKPPYGYENEIKALKGSKSIAIVRNGMEGRERDIIKPLRSAYNKTPRLEKLSAQLGATTESWVRTMTRTIFGED